MRTAYGTYALPTYSLEDALRLIAELGYDGVEICVGPRHTPVEALTPERCAAVRALLGELGLGVPALMLISAHLWNPDPDKHRATLEHVRACAAAAHALGARPVLSVGFGGRTAEWETIRAPFAELLADYARLGWEEGVVIAGEAHCGAAVDRSERVMWLLDQVASPEVRLHFDIVHMYLAGEDEADAVARLLPYTAHTHITDARKHADGTFDLLLLGQGDLDAAKYVRAMAAGGWDDFITLEVSARVWDAPGYDPVEAARFSLASLRGAMGPVTPG
ncbi:MAG: sugar phosphate isomerase/epimerase [Armatimonadetes bacterium]|nr:sugar phosphate isomerase/epimerase [Armatimonadota bacterium]